MSRCSWDLDDAEIEALRQAVAPLLVQFGADPSDPELRIELRPARGSGSPAVASVYANELGLFDDPRDFTVTPPGFVPVALLDDAVETIQVVRELLRRTVWGA